MDLGMRPFGVTIFFGNDGENSDFKTVKIKVPSTTPFPNII
jgi:hypothetical protein